MPSWEKASCRRCLKPGGVRSRITASLTAFKLDRSAWGVPPKPASFTKSTDTSALASSCSAASNAPNGTATLAGSFTHPGSRPCPSKSASAHSMRQVGYKLERLYVPHWTLGKPFTKQAGTTHCAPARSVIGALPAA